MLLSHPISSVIPSVDGLALEVLAGTTLPLNLTEVHALAPVVSLSGMRKALLRLVDSGVVHRVPGGYVLNREHLACGAIASLAGMRGELFERLRTHVESWPTIPDLVGVFGSAARREGDSESDIDIVVLTDATDADELAGELADAVERWTGNPGHVVIMSHSDLARLRRHKDPLLDELRRDLITVLGDSESFIGAA